MRIRILSTEEQVQVFVESLEGCITCHLQANFHFELINGSGEDQEEAMYHLDRYQELTTQAVDCDGDHHIEL